MRKLALLVIDLQNGFLRNCPEAATQLLSDAFPEMRAKRIYLNIKGTEGCLHHPDLQVEPSNKVIIKKRCGFSWCARQAAARFMSCGLFS